ncbi:HCLS1-associated protein X-1 [Gadus chalcogrammus]|uniref:HCLS1-associated protein X-1 n=1 Tax=Gadus chalcogrammus TaxID=1042646 RepID=UPI0024C48F21|nr:HCLS1-associated protein X-1 [Gadus chalcogrammus]
MSVFDLFRGFFGVPGGQYRGDGRRDPFFDGMTHDDDDDDDDDAYQEDGFPQDGYCGDQREPFDNALRFGFSFGPNGMRIDEPPLFGHVLRGMEEIFSHLSRFEEQHGTGPFDIPRIMPPSHEGSDNNGQRSSSGNALRDSMLKSQEDAIQRHRAPAVPPRDEDTPSLPSSPFHGWSPFPKFNDIWTQGPKGRPEGRREDGDLDSAVSSGGLDKILTPRPSETPSQPRSRSYFQSVIVSKVVKPDGSVEERRTVRDGQGNEETTVTRSGAQGSPAAPTKGDGPLGPGGGQLFSDLRDDGSMFPRFFGGFK